MDPAATAEALFAAAAALADDDALDRQACTNVLWSLASLSLAPPERTWAALRRALQRHAPELDRQELCNVLWAVRVLAELPGQPCDAGTLAALGDAVARGPELDVQGFANCCRLVRAVRWVPGAAALDERNRRQQELDLARRVLRFSFSFHLAFIYTDVKMTVNG